MSANRVSSKTGLAQDPKSPIAQPVAQPFAYSTYLYLPATNHP